MSKKVYSASSIPVPEAPVPETVTIHLKVDRNEAAMGDDDSLVSAFEDNNIFVARPFEIDDNSGRDLMTEVPQYDPDDVHQSDGARLVNPVKEEKPSSYAKKVVGLLKDFSEKNKVGEWSFSTSTLCHWCCHAFNSVPIGVPVRYDGKHFYVTGCFCGFACAAAHNNSSGEDNMTVAKRYSLLCTLAAKSGCNEHIRVAPPRLALACFGGYLSIEEFRAFSDSGRVMIVNLPPMRSVAQQIEEVNEGDVGAGYNFIPIEHVRNERGLNASLSLKRNKPLLNLKNTLHNSMNVQIIPGE